jgi:hypothetical protein
LHLAIYIPECCIALWNAQTDGKEARSIPYKGGVKVEAQQGSGWGLFHCILMKTKD